MTQNGITSLRSHRSVDEVQGRLEQTLQERGVKLFCLVDHSGEAEAAGLAMPTTRLLIFGSPRAGTPVMLDTPSAALDLPLKILIADTPGGTVLSWSDPVWLQQRHGFSESLVANLKAVEVLAHAAAG